MEHYIHSLRTVLALLIVAIAMTISTGMPISAHAAAGQKTDNPGKSDAAPGHNKDEDEEQRNKIRKDEEQRLKKGKGKEEGQEQGQENLSYPQQAKSLAERLRESAAIVAQQGGNAQPLLDAAAYFDKEAE